MTQITLDYKNQLTNNINWGSQACGCNKEVPRTQGTSGNDNFELGTLTTGLFNAGNGNDKFEYYDKPGTKNTLLNGEGGVDTFSLSKLTAQQALTALKQNGYTFIKTPRGFSLQTRDGQRIDAVNIELVTFSDKTFDLRKSTDRQALLKALSTAGIPITDETSYAANPHITNGLIPIGNPNTFYNSMRQNTGYPQYGQTGYPQMNNLNGLIPVSPSSLYPQSSNSPYGYSRNHSSDFMSPFKGNPEYKPQHGQVNYEEALHFMKLGYMFSEMMRRQNNSIDYSHGDDWDVNPRSYDGGLTLSASLMNEYYRREY